MGEQYLPDTLVLLNLRGGRVLGRISHVLDTGWYQVCGTQPLRVIDPATEQDTGTTIFHGYEVPTSSITPVPAEHQHLNPGMLRELYNLPDERFI